MISNKGRYVIIVLACILLIYRLIELDTNNYWSINNIIDLVVPILLIIAMVSSIIHVNKHGEN